MEKKNQNAGFAVYFSIASAWFGTHCGSGFASGVQIVSFWTSYGAYAIFLPVISVILMAVVAYIQWEFCRQNKTYDYRSFADKLFSPYDKVFGTIYEILFIAMMIMAASAVFAGAGEVINQIFGLPFVLSVIVFMALVVVLNMFGTKLLLASSSILSTMLIAVIIIVAVLSIGRNGGHLVEVVSTWQTDRSWWSAILSAIFYGSFQCLVFAATLNLSEGIATKGDTKKSAVLGLLMNGAMMILMSYMLLCFYPDVNSEPLPVLAVLSQLGIPALETVYSVMLFLAFMTTALTCIGAALKRIEKFGAAKIPNITTRRALYSAVIILICFAIAQFGLLAIIRRGYGSLGYLGIPFVIIPTLFIGGRKIRAKVNGGE